MYRPQPNEQAAKTPVRIIVEVPHESEVQRLWVLVPNDLLTVEDLTVHLSEKFLQQPKHTSAEVVLNIDGIPVAPDQDIAIIRDSDIVQVSLHAAPLRLEAPTQQLLIEGPNNSGGPDKGFIDQKAGVVRDGMHHRKSIDAAASEAGGKQGKRKLDKKQTEGDLLMEEWNERLKKRRKMYEAMAEENGTADLQGQVKVKKRRKQMAEKGEKHSLVLEGIGNEKVTEKERRRESKGQEPDLLPTSSFQQLSKHNTNGQANDTTPEGSGKKLSQDEGAVSRSVLQKEEPVETKEETGVLQEAARDQKVMKRGSKSGEEDSEGEAPTDSKKTPSRSARRKSAKRRYARLAKEAVARGEAHDALADGPDHKHSMAPEPLPQRDENAEAATRPLPGHPLMQHVRFDDTDSEGAGRKMEAARQLPMTLNIGFGASGQPLSKERGKEWGKHKDRKKDRHRNQNGRAEVPPPQHTGIHMETANQAAEQDGPYPDRVNSSVECRSVDSDEAKRNGESRTEAGLEAGLAWGKKKSEQEYEQLPELNRLPQVADVLAYRLVELTSAWTPQISEYREGRVAAYDEASGAISLVWWPPEEASAKREAAFKKEQSEQHEEGAVEVFGPPYDSDGNLQVEYSALLGVRLVQSSERTLAQLPEAPALPATNTTSLASDGSPYDDAAQDVAPRIPLSAEPASNRPAFEPSRSALPATKPTSFVGEKSPMSLLGGQHQDLRKGREESVVESEPVKDASEVEGRPEESEKPQGQEMSVESPNGRGSSMKVHAQEVLERDHPKGLVSHRVEATGDPQNDEAPPLAETRKEDSLAHGGFADHGSKEKLQLLGEKPTGNPGQERACADVTEGSADVTRALGQTPQAWRQWESVANLLSKRRAEIARQAAMQKLESLGTSKESLQEARKNGNGLPQATERKCDRKEMEGSDCEKQVRTDGVASQETGQAGGTRPEARELPVQLSNEKDANVVEKGLLKLPNGKAAETGEKVLTPEPLGSRADLSTPPQSPEELSALVSPKRNVRQANPDGGDFVEARDLRGLENNAHRHGVKPSSVNVRGATKPRAPRLGALGPTLAYLRAQQNQLG